MVKTQANKADYNRSMSKAAELVKNADDILILTHSSPDGDTLGSAFALSRALEKLGKTYRVECSDSIPRKYGYLYRNTGCQAKDFKPKFIVAVDIASVNLFGDKLMEYSGNVDLCIDHHPSNSGYARFTLLNPAAAATCEIILGVILKLGVDIDADIADCIYTGITTDTGCFRYSNTTPDTLRCGAKMIECGANAAYINKVMFETSSRERFELERQVLNTLEYYFDGRAALIYITHEMCEKTGVSESELEGIPSLPARIEGVDVGITIKEKQSGVYKISLRTNQSVNASDICAVFGGGGHAAAAGCQIEGALDDVKHKIVAAVGKAFGNA